MNTTQHTLNDTALDTRRLIAGLRQALEMNYARVLATAGAQWERNFAGTDSSDACVTVRISSGKPRAGVLRKPAGFLQGTARALLA